jgi:hypothetical protein
MNALSNRTRNTMLILGLIQGLVLLAAHLVVARDILKAPADLVWLVPWWAAAIGMFTALQLLVTDRAHRRAWFVGLALLSVLVVTGAYAGYSIEPSADSRTGPLLMPYVFTIIIGWYVLLPFAQTYLQTGRPRPDYPVLFEFAWNNGITLLIAAFFTGIFWALLALWAGLFAVIKIKFFYTLFYNKYFAYPVTAVVFAFALYLGRSHVSAVVTVRRVILAVFKGLLPLLAVITLLFLAALPFMGLQPLWATGNATTLMLTLEILLLFFLNAVFQNGEGEAPYPGWLRGLVRAAIVALPVYTVLCAYALHLRLDQHGWSTERFWAVLLAFVVGLYAFGYAIAALRRSAVWMGGMAPVNIAIAAVVVALSVAVNTPLLDAQRISAASQVARLLDGRVAAAKFDYKYLRFDLGRAGNAALTRLKDIGDRPDAPVIRTSAEQALKQTDRYWVSIPATDTPAEAAAHFTVYPRGQRLSDSFLQYVMGKDPHWQLRDCLDVGQRCLLLVADMNHDKRNDYVVFRIGRYDRIAGVYTDSDKGWEFAGTFNLWFQKNPVTIEELETLLAKADYALPESPWRNLKIGNVTQQFRPQ